MRSSGQEWLTGCLAINVKREGEKNESKNLHVSGGSEYRKQYE